MTAKLLTTRSSTLPSRPGKRTTRQKRERAGLRIAYLLFSLMLLCLGVGVVAFIFVNLPGAPFGGPFLANPPQGNQAFNAGSAPLAPPQVTKAQAVPATATATPTSSPTATLTATPTASATATQTATFTPTPTETPTEQDTPTPLPTDTPEPTLPAAALPAPAAQSSAGGGVKWIEVDLSDQMLYAWEGKTLVASFLVSTGAAPYHTITGSYPIYEKHRTANMWGPGYFYPDVPYTMYFYKGYGIHGTYWHSNFGTPMSRGCVNMSIADAEWLYYWASLNTSVKVHQ